MCWNSTSPLMLIGAWKSLTLSAIAGSCFMTSLMRVIEAAPCWKRLTTQPKAIIGQVAHELHELTERNTSINHIETTAPQQDHCGKSRQEVHSRPQQRIEAGVADAEAHIFPVGGAKCL